MRNWHELIIKRNLLSPNLINGSENIVCGVIEGLIDFDYETSLDIPNIDEYEAYSQSLVGESGQKKTFARLLSPGLYNSTNYTENLMFKERSSHATSVGGLIAGKIGDETPENKIPQSLNGVTPNSRIINSKADLVYMIGQSLVQIYFNKNILSSFVFQNFIAGPSDLLKQFRPPKLPYPESDDNPNDYSLLRTSIINFSIKPTENDEKGIDFILKELGAYGREGRGILCVFGAGNDSKGNNPSEKVDLINEQIAAKSKIPLIVGASRIDLKAGGSFEKWSTIYPQNPDLIPESRSIYSNIGSRLDLCAPSSPDTTASKSDLDIYTVTSRNSGEIGSEDQVLNINIVEVNSNSRFRLENVNGVLEGQSIELGSPDSFIHELRFIKKVNSSNNTVDLNEDLYFTKNNNNPPFSLVGSQARITVLKIPVINKISNNKVSIGNREGIGNPPADNPAKRQKIFIYPESDINLGIFTKISNVSTSTSIILEFEDIFDFSEDLFIIPGQILTEVVGLSPGSYNIKPNFHLDGFFPNQLVQIGDFITNITALRNDYTMKRVTFKFYKNVNHVGQTVSLKSLSYGDYTSSFGGTSASTPITSGLAALLLNANPNLNFSEIKHILKEKAKKIGGSYNVNPDGYTHNDDYGAGRINAAESVQLALDWHNPLTVKPIMKFFDNAGGTIVGVNEPVDSRDIWIKDINDSSSTLPSDTTPYNTATTTNDQKIFVRVRNIGTRQSFSDYTLRVFLTFTDEANPAFEFPDKWFHQPTSSIGEKTILLGIEEIPYVGPNDEVIIELEWKALQINWKQWNPLNKKSYILAQIAPFDGLPEDVSLTNIRNNKQLTCREIIVTHLDITQGENLLPGNKLDISVGAEIIEKSFELNILNIANNYLQDTKIKATKKDRSDQSEESVFFTKNSNDEWEIEGGLTPDWIAFSNPTIENAVNTGYKNTIFPHTIKVNQEELEVKLELVNT